MSHGNDDVETEEAIPTASIAGPEEWLMASASGDQAAFEKLYRQFAPRVLAFLDKRSSDRVALADLLQEIFLAVWRKAGLFQPGHGTADQWIFTIARHKLFDAWRRVSRLKEDLFDPASEPAQARSDSQDSGLELLSLVDKLEPNLKQIVQVLYFDGLTLEEGAVRLRTPIGTLKSRLHKALANLRILCSEREGQ